MIIHSSQYENESVSEYKMRMRKIKTLKLYSGHSQTVCHVFPLVPNSTVGIHVFPRIPTYSHVFPFVFPRPIYRLEKTFIFQFSKLYIPGIPTGNTVCCRRLCWADGIPMGIRGNTVCCRPSGNALTRNEKKKFILNEGRWKLEEKKKKKDS